MIASSTAFNSNNSTQYFSFVWTQVSNLKYCYVSLTIQLNLSHISKSHLFALSLNIKQFYRPIPRTLSGATTPVKKGSEGVLHIPPNSSITGASPSDSFVKYLGYSLVAGSYPSAEMQSVYSTALSDWPVIFWEFVGLVGFWFHCCMTDQPSWVI